MTKLAKPFYVLSPQQEAAILLRIFPQRVSSLLAQDCRQGWKRCVQLESESLGFVAEHEIQWVLESLGARYGLSTKELQDAVAATPGPLSQMLQDLDLESNLPKADYRVYYSPCGKSLLRP